MSLVSLKLTLILVLNCIVSRFYLHFIELRMMRYTVKTYLVNYNLLRTNLETNRQPSRNVMVDKVSVMFA